MTIVVKKVPKFLRGFVKLIFSFYNIEFFNNWTLLFCSYKTLYPLDFRHSLTSMISSVWNTIIGLPESRLKERYR